METRNYKTITSLRNNLLSIILIIFFATSCSLFYTYKHRPCFLTQASVVFVDKNGIAYSNTNGFKKYSSKSKNYYQNVLFSDSNGCLNYVSSTCNDDYIFITLLHSSNTDEYSILRIFDNHFNFVRDVFLENGAVMFGIECENNHVYFSTRKDNNCKLIKYSVKSNIIDTVMETIDSSRTFSDENIDLFFDSRCGVHKISTKTKLVHDNEDSKGECLTTSNIKLFIESANAIEICNNGQNVSFDNIDGFNAYYPNAYLDNNTLVFATYKYTNNNECFYCHDCMCSRKESFLYSFDLNSNELKLIQEYKSGTFLIDYCLDSVEYYYDGGLYINNLLKKECEKVKPAAAEKLGVFDEIKYSDAVIDYYLAFYNGNFFGIR